jgi:hypothetical protein
MHLRCSIYKKIHRIVTQTAGGPPKSRVYSSKAHHELQHNDFTIKTKNAGLHSLAKRKWKNRAKIVFASNTLLIRIV